MGNLLAYCEVNFQRKEVRREGVRAQGLHGASVEGSWAQTKGSEAREHIGSHWATVRSGRGRCLLIFALCK